MEKLLRTLIVDDSRVFCEMLKHELESFDIDLVDTCQSGERALELIRPLKCHYDAVFVDLHMQGMDGIELIRELDKLHYRGGVIIVSALDETIVEHTMEVVRKLNVQLLGSILKPFDRSLIAFMVRRIRNMRPLNPTSPPLSKRTVRHALAEGRLEVYFQPLVNGLDNSLHSVECMSRLLDESNKTIMPDMFLPAIAHFNLFNEFMPLFLKKALQDYKDICKRMHIEVPLRINIHHRQLEDDEFPRKLSDTVNQADVEPQKLILEISERSPSNENHLRNLARLGIAGFKLSLDDYGSGSTNIRQLNTLPFGDIKIDQELINGMHRDRALRTIVAALKHVADELHIEVIGKGVNDPSELILLDEMGIHYFQGHFFSRPKPASECVRWLKKWKVVLEKTKDSPSRKKSERF